MDQQEIRSLLEQVAQGQRSVDEAVLALKMEPFQELGFAKVDNHRGLRQGAAEVIRLYAADRGKGHPHHPHVARGRPGGGGGFTP